MKKKFIFYTLFGFMAGIFIFQTISLILSGIYSSVYHTSSYTPFVPEFVTQMGSSLNAAIAQYCIAGIIGAGFSASSLVWQIEHWSLLKQTLIHFTILTCIMLPLAWFTWWMPHSVAGILSYLGIFVIIYSIIFVISIFAMKQKIKKVNKALKNKVNT